LIQYVTWYEDKGHFTIPAIWGLWVCLSLQSFGPTSCNKLPGHNQFSSFTIIPIKASVRER
jgi:hypothetical protein